MKSVMFTDASCDTFILDTSCYTVGSKRPMLGTKPYGYFGDALAFVSNPSPLSFDEFCNSLVSLPKPNATVLFQPAAATATVTATSPTASVAPASGVKKSFTFLPLTRLGKKRKQCEPEEELVEEEEQQQQPPPAKKPKKKKLRIYTEEEKQEAISYLRTIKAKCSDSRVKRRVGGDHQDYRKLFLSQPPCKTPRLLQVLAKMSRMDLADAQAPGLRNEHSIAATIIAEEAPYIKITDEDDCSGYVFDEKTKLWEKKTAKFISPLIPDILTQWRKKNGKTEEDLIDTDFAKCFSATKSKNILHFSKLFQFDKEFREKVNAYPALLPLKGGKVIDLTTLVRDRTMEDLWSFELPVTFQLDCSQVLAFKEEFHSIVGHSPSETSEIELT